MKNQNQNNHHSNFINNYIKQQRIFLELEPVYAIRVQRAIDETGSNAFGIIGIDIWTLNDNDGCLYHVGKGVNWVNPLYTAELEENATNGDT